MKYLHVSKKLIDIGYLLGSSGAGSTYISSDTAKTNARKARRCGLTTARQQRKYIKAWRANNKSEAAMDARIAEHEANMDWQEDEVENNAFERERRADELYEEHFG
jgi:hypothetical protein